MKPIMRFVVALVSLFGVLAAAGPARAHGAAVSRFVASVGEHELAVRASLHLESVLELVEGSHDLAHTGEGQAAIARHEAANTELPARAPDVSLRGKLCVPASRGLRDRGGSVVRQGRPRVRLSEAYFPAVGDVDALRGNGRTAPHRG